MNSESIKLDKKEQLQFIKDTAVEKGKDYIKRAGEWMNVIFQGNN